MQSAFFFKNMTRGEQDKLQKYVESKFPQIEKLLTNFSSDSVRLEVKAEKFEKHSAFNVEFVLFLNSDSIKSGETSHAYTKSVDLSKDRLEMQIKKYIAQMRRGHRNVKEKRQLKQEAGMPELQTS